MTYTRDDFYSDYLRQGSRARRHLTRTSLLSSLAGIAGERAYAGLCISSWRARAAVHESSHAVAGFVWGLPGQSLAIAVWDEPERKGGLCGRFDSLKAAQAAYYEPIEPGEARWDMDRVGQVTPAFQAVIGTDPTERLISALVRLFRLPRYERVIRRLAHAVYERGYVQHEEVYEITAAGLQRSSTVGLQPSLDPDLPGQA